MSGQQTSPQEDTMADPTNDANSSPFQLHITFKQLRPEHTNEITLDAASPRIEDVRDAIAARLGEDFRGVRLIHVRIL